MSSRARSWGLAGALDSSIVDLAHCCYDNQDVVTRSIQRCHASPFRRSTGSACGAGNRGSNAMGSPRVTTARRVVGTRPNGRRGLRGGNCRPSHRRRCGPSRGRCAPSGTPSAVPGVSRWSRWNSIPVPRRATAAPCARRPQHAKEQRSGCGGCGHGGSRCRRVLHSQRYRNSSQRFPAAVGWWGRSQEVWMQDPPRRARAPLQVRVTFEPTRLATEHLVVAYDHVMPTRSRVAGTPARAAPQSACPEQAAPAKERA